MLRTVGLFEPSGTLLGCCSGVTGVYYLYSCYYQGDTDVTPSKCAAEGGTWSTSIS
jgi:hypothetical protein